MHSRPHAHISRSASQEHLTPASRLHVPGDRLITKIEPDQVGTDEPLTRAVLRLVRLIRKPEPRFHVVAQARLLSTSRPQQYMKVFVGHQSLSIEKTGVRPVTG